MLTTSALKSLPQGQKENSQPKKRTIWPIFAMLMVFGLPYPVAWYFVFSEDPVFHLSQKPHGVLVSPIQAIAGATINKVLPEGGSEQWKLVFFAPSVCETSCLKTLFLMQQARRAQGVERNTISRLVFFEEDSKLNSEQLAEQYPGTIFVSQPRGERARFSGPFVQVASTLDQRLFLVDPGNNLMMYYTEAVTPKGLIGDLAKLTKH